MKKIICLIGQHGTGKSTIGKMLKINHGWTHISIGDLGRGIRKGVRHEWLPIRLQAEIAKCIPGQPITDKACDALLMAVQDLRRSEPVVIDGFPASPEHVAKCPLDFWVVKVTSGESLRQERLLRRAEKTARQWQPGLTSQRDNLVNETYSACADKGLITHTITNDDDLSQSRCLQMEWKQIFGV